MRKYFSLLFWGLLLVILDFSINGIDLLADGIGYLLIAAGCNGLSIHSPRFRAARLLCFLLALLWLAGFTIRGDTALIYIHGIVTTIVVCIMMWQLLGGIAEFALNRQRTDLATRAHNRRIAYVAVVVATSFITYAFRGPSTAGAWMIVLVVSMLVLLVMILHLIHRAKTELAD